MKIYLVGFMGSGKSLLAKHLARKLGCACHDLDAHIEKGEGKSITSIFSEQGEAHFRSLETSYLRGTAALPPSVIATGGGTPCHHGNLEWMNGHGVTLYLQVGVETLCQRLRQEQSGRPLLAEKSDDELKSYVAGLLAERSDCYEKAHFVCDADAPIDELVPALAHYFARFLP